MSTVDIDTLSLGGGPGALSGVSRLGFGCMGLTAFYGPPQPEAAALEVLRGVYALGVTHFDTAEVYRSGDPFAPPSSDEDKAKIEFNEVIVGKFLAGLRGEAYRGTGNGVAGFQAGRAAASDAATEAGSTGEAGSEGRGARPYTIATKFFPGLREGRVDTATVAEAVDASLARLGERVIDLYYCHRMPATVELLEEWMRSVAVQVEAGKIRAIGLSEVSAAWLRRAHAIHPVAAVQMEWSLLTRGIEADLIPTLRELSIAVVAYSPLARNLLTLAPSAAPPSSGDRRAHLPRFSAESFERNKELVAVVAKAAETRGITAAQLSLAWLYQRATELGVVVVAIPGTTKLPHAEENVAALGALPLPEDVMAAVAELAARVEGQRYPEQGMAVAYEGQEKRESA